MNNLKLAPAPLVEWTTNLIQRTRGSEVVAKQKDWEVVYELADYFFNNYPQEGEEFRRTIPQIRELRRNKRALSETGEIKYLAAFPLRFMGMIRAVFPKQEFDKKFIYNLIWRMPLFRIGQSKE